MHGTLSAETFLAVIVLSFGVMQPLITAFSYTDDIAQVKTIARLIASLWDVKDGAIELGGVDIHTLPLAKCTKRIAYVSQDNYLFDLSVMDNIRMGKKGATDEEVIDAAKKRLSAFIMGLENGYQTVCGASGGHLSGSERQRISIARAVLKDAPIVILDEATSYTDPENEAVIQSALAKLVRGKTLLVIAHRLSTIADADQIIVVNTARSSRRHTGRSCLPLARFIKPCGKPTSASKTTGRQYHAQDTEKVLRLLRQRKPQAICHLCLAGRGQRHLLRHADSRRRHRHSGAAY